MPLNFKIMKTIYSLLIITILLVSCTKETISSENATENSIYELKSYNINGIEQHVLIRGVDKNNPILLFLHGGPGMPDMFFSTKFDKELEEEFVVVHWDRRFTGKTFDKKNIGEFDLTIKLLEEDTKLLVDILKSEFEKEKIILIGHSFGTILGARYATKYPEDLYGYIGISQVVDFEKNEGGSYDYALEKAKEAENKKATKQLEELDFSNGITFENHAIVWKWNLYFGGVVYGEKDFKFINRSASQSEEYSLKDFLRFKNGAKYSQETLWKEISNVKLDTENTEFKVPMYFIVGENDYAAVNLYAEDYYNLISAPKKDFFRIEEASHMVQYEQNEEFENILINIIKPEIIKLKF